MSGHCHCVERPPAGELCPTCGGVRDMVGPEVARLLKELAQVSGKRIHASVIPARWSDDQVQRLTRCMNKVLDAGEGGLRTIEDALSG